MNKINFTKINLIALKTICKGEILRFARIWPQTLLPAIITMSLYFLIFGAFIGPRIGNVDGVTYMQFIAPGLIMMSVITNSYANVVSSFYSLRFQKSIEEILVAPVPLWLILIGYTSGGVFRGVIVGGLVTLVALFFTHLHIHHILLTISVVLMSSILFSLAGFTNALYARKFDDIAIIPTFILTPLIYLGGVFYSISQLPHFWRELSKFNPILYMVDSFRFGILGISDVKIVFAMLAIVLFVVTLFTVNLMLLHKGVGIRT